MTLPIDIAGTKHAWTRERSHTWTDEAMRRSVDTFLDLFAAEHGWVREMRVTERFTDTGVNVRVPRGPTAPPEERPFYQRSGLPVIVIVAVRDRDSQEFEVALPFAEANETNGVTVARLFENARLSLREQEGAAR